MNKFQAILDQPLEGSYALQDGQQAILERIREDPDNVLIGAYTRPGPHYQDQQSVNDFFAGQDIIFLKVHEALNTGRDSVTGDDNENI